jgi:hypothetical protein
VQPVVEQDRPDAIRQATQDVRRVDVEDLEHSRIHDEKDEKSSSGTVLPVMEGRPRMYWSASVTSHAAWLGVRIVVRTWERPPLTKKVVFWWSHMWDGLLWTGSRRSGSAVSRRRLTRHSGT